ncbi:MAG: GFA family protein [Rhizomicrobium sp.]
MIEATCHCGAVRIEVAAAPDIVMSCNCSICRRLGTLAAHCSPRDVKVSGATDTYVWGDRMLVFHRCRVCGCHTHSMPVDISSDRMSVNARLLPPEILAKARVRRFDGAESWTFLDP